MYVSGFNSVNEEWTETGASPWLNDNTGNYISTSTDEYWHEEFSFADSGVGTGTINSVNLYLEINGPSARNDFVNIDLYDGSSWNDIADQDPDADAYQWYNFDVSLVIDSWTKIDAALLRVQYQRSGSPSTETIYIRKAYLYIDYSSGPEVYSFDLPETAAVSSSLETQKNIYSVSSESITVTATTLTTKTLIRISGESTSVTTTLESSKGLQEVTSELFETAAVSASLVIVKALSFVLPETGSVTAALNILKAIFPVLQSTISISDATELLKTMFKTASTTFVVTAVLETSKEITAVVTDIFETASVTAALNIVKSLLLTLPETADLTGVLDTLRNVPAILTGIANATGSLETLKGMFTVATELFNSTALLDTWMHIGAIFINMFETLPFSGSLITILPEIELTAEDAIVIGIIALALALCAFAYVATRKQE